VPTDGPGAKRLGYVLFCDQARLEQQGKGLFIGTYGSTMLVDGSFPVFLASLAIVVCVYPARQTESLRAQLFMPGFDEAITFDTGMKAKNRHDSLMWVLTVSPCVFKASGECRIVVRFEDGHEESGSLSVIAKATHEAASWKT
jgi:hypothetical protein